MIDSNELRKGVTFTVDGQLYKVLDYHHHKPGRGQATIRVKARNLRTGANIEMTFTSSQRVEEVRLTYHNAQYLYNDGEFYYFMDNETFEQYALPKAVLGEGVHFLMENMDVKLTFYGNEPLDVELPTTVDVKVVEAEVAVRGDTATGLTKKVKVETGYEVQVPAFVNTGDTIRIDTRTGDYVTRV